MFVDISVLEINGSGLNKPTNVSIYMYMQFFRTYVRLHLIFLSNYQVLKTCVVKEMRYNDRSL